MQILCNYCLVWPISQQFSLPTRDSGAYAVRPCLVAEKGEPLGTPSNQWRLIPRVGVLGEALNYKKKKFSFFKKRGFIKITNPHHRENIGFCNLCILHVSLCICIGVCVWPGGGGGKSWMGFFFCGVFFFFF